MNACTCVGQPSFFFTQAFPVARTTVTQCHKPTRRSVTVPVMFTHLISSVVRQAPDMRPMCGPKQIQWVSCLAGYCLPTYLCAYLPLHISLHHLLQVLTMLTVQVGTCVVLPPPSQHSTQSRISSASKHTNPNTAGWAGRPHVTRLGHGSSSPLRRGINEASKPRSTARPRPVTPSPQTPSSQEILHFGLFPYTSRYIADVGPPRPSVSPSATPLPTRKGPSPKAKSQTLKVKARKNKSPPSCPLPALPGRDQLCALVSRYLAGRVGSRAWLAGWVLRGRVSVGVVVAVCGEVTSGEVRSGEVGRGAIRGRGGCGCRGGGGGGGRASE